MNLRRTLKLVTFLCLWAVGARAEEAVATPSAVVPASVLKAYDRDKSGDLSPEEFARWEAAKEARREKYAAQRAEMLARYDTDGDGRISDAEKAAATMSMQSARTEAETERIKKQAAAQAKAKAESQAGAESATDKDAGAAMSAEPTMEGGMAPTMMQ